MPYRWLIHPDNDQTAPDDSGAVCDHVIAKLELWPHRSLPRIGFVWTIALTALALAAPLLAVLGSAVWWGLLPFALFTIWMLWFALQRSYRSGQTHETLVLMHDTLRITRHDPGRTDHLWQTNPYWARCTIRKGPVASYLTLTDGRREVELGAFLTPEERLDLARSIGRALAFQLG